MSLIAGLELVAAIGSLGDSLNRISSVVVTHELSEGGAGDQNTKVADTLDQTTNGDRIVLGCGFDA